MEGQEFNRESQIFKSSQGLNVHILMFLNTHIHLILPDKQ
ncbi:hypothetical protein P308_19875 [Pseudomonas piscis]|nr:hypothetical protein P308_19875 [Pseudomonas piscis]